MAKTAVVNPSRRRRSASGQFLPATTRRRTARRRNPATPNPRRRRKYGAARRRATAKRRAPRRRNPSIQQVYSSGGYRQKNPELFDIDHILEIMPAATGGIWAARWAMKMAGPFEPEKTTTASGQVAEYSVPGIKHAFAGVLAARIGSGIVGQVLGDPSKAHFAEIAALGFVGDLFLRTRVLRDSQWVADNLMLQGVDDPELCESTSDQAGGDEMGAAQYVVGPDGLVYELNGIAPDPAHVPTMRGLQDQSALGGLQDQSALGRPRASTHSSFGYS